MDNLSAGAVALASTALTNVTWTDARAGYLDNLSAGAVALAATALTDATWTDARAGYLDNISAGAVALVTTVTTAHSTTDGLIGGITDATTDSIHGKIGTDTEMADVSLYDMHTGSSDATNRVAGKTQIKTTAVTSAADAGDVTMATTTTQPCMLKSVVVHSDGATTVDLTNITVKCGASKVVTIIDAVSGVKANIDAQDEQVAWDGAIYLPTGATVVMTLTGTGATAVDLNCVVEYKSCVNGGYLA